MTIYYTSDLHLGHKNIIEYENRPFKTVEEMDEVLIDNWNSRITPEDDVYVLGDFTFKGTTMAIKYLECLNGSIHLLKGNHDQFMNQDSFDMWLCDMHNRDLHSGRVYTHVRDEGYYAHINDNEREVILFHYPIMFWDGQDDRGSYHLYGHMHSTSHGGTQHPHPDAFNVGVDVNDFMPVTLDELIERRKK